MIYAVRHGETDWNKERIIQGGISNIPLNDEGIKQAQHVAQKLKDKGIKKIYSSDLLRAKQTTAEINKELMLDVEYSPLLRETSYGIIEGKKAEIIESTPEYVSICQAVDKGDNDAHFPGGESRNMVVKRFMDFLSTIDENEDILIITHGGILRSFSCIYAGIDKKIPNTGGLTFTLKKGKPYDIKLFE